MAATPSAAPPGPGPDAGDADPRGRLRAPLTPAGRGPLAWLLDWAALLALLVIAVPPLALEPAGRDTHRVMENVSVGSSQETWLRLHGYRGAEALPGPPGVVPSWGGHPRLTKPPGLVWANLAVTADLSPDTASPRDVLARYRLLSAGLWALAIAATFWAGVTLAGRSAGLAAAAVVASMIFLGMKAGRTASYDTHLAGWCTLAVAAGLWAMRPTGPATGGLRKLAGWGLGFVALSAALWTKGPVALALVGGPWVALAAMTRGRRIPSLASASAVTLAAFVAFAAPYALILEWAQPGALKALLDKEYTAERKESDYQSPAYYLMLLGWVVPWTAYLIGGLLLPWLKVTGEARRPVWAALAWLGALAVLLSIPGAKQERYAVPMLPAAGLLCALVLVTHDRLRRAGAPDTGAPLLYLPTAIVSALAALALAALVLMQGTFIDWGWLEDAQIDPASPKWVAVAMLVPIGLAVAAVLLWRKHRAVAAGLTLALSVCVTGGAYWSLYARAQGQNDPSIPAGIAIDRLVADAPLYELTGPQRTLTPLVDREAFLFGLRRIVPRITPDELREAGKRALPDDPPVFVFAEPTDPDNLRMTRLGFQLVDDAVPVDHNNTLRLWRRDAPTPPEIAAELATQPAEPADAREPALASPTGATATQPLATQPVAAPPTPARSPHTAPASAPQPSTRPAAATQPSTAP
ncbi:MAG: hypothetical protein AAGA57_00590 [Planctomycetota bacterium]